MSVRTAVRRPHFPLQLSDPLGAPIEKTTDPPIGWPSADTTRQLRSMRPFVDCREPDGDVRRHVPRLSLEIDGFRRPVSRGAWTSGDTASLNVKVTTAGGVVRTPAPSAGSDPAEARRARGRRWPKTTSACSAVISRPRQHRASRRRRPSAPASRPAPASRNRRQICRRPGSRSTVDAALAFLHDRPIKRRAGLEVRA